MVPRVLILLGQRVVAGRDFGVMFTAVKRKKLRHFQFFKFESVQTCTSAKFEWKRCIKCPDKTNFAPTKLVDVSYFIWTHTRRKKLKFSETALSFAVKAKLSTLVSIFRVKLWLELRTRRAFDRCEGTRSAYVWPEKKRQSSLGAWHQ